MAYSESQKNATMKYQKNNYDQIAIRVPKGKREEYKEKAKLNGFSLASYIMHLIETDPLPDEIELLQEADTSELIPHDSINWK